MEKHTVPLNSLAKNIDEKVLEKVRMLDGVSLIEWQKIKIIMDSTFSKQIGEFKQQLKLSCDDLVIPL